MLKANGDSLSGKTVIVSGSGNVAIYAAEKATQMGAKVVAMSDSGGYIYDKNGIDIGTVKYLKEANRKRISEYLVMHAEASYHEDPHGLWDIPCNVALPCATQNEIDEQDAKNLLKNGCKAVAEGANMPSTPSAIEIYLQNNILYGPAKAANAGGVAVSGLEMSQNSTRLSWTFEQVDMRLQLIMKDIFRITDQAAQNHGIPGNYMAGANIAGFLKVAEAMKAQGCV